MSHDKYLQNRSYDCYCMYRIGEFPVINENKFKQMKNLWDLMFFLNNFN